MRNETTIIDKHEQQNGKWEHYGNTNYGKNSIG